ncbi:uncharacterized protein LOC34623302 [Cyclospora cayetanensis]|uniref:Uncharacterized protein LOC34623302 n=1 Tax=Cyclospora cayetanensis TaxID=88456 RepID=A0A6P6RUV6_9EIME|nr:uncharacterized protein LOC34623302 [Cyclospora cayetanensis]
MLNLLPKRSVAVSLLQGKRALQRVQVGSGKHQLELPQASVDALYSKINTTDAYHNKDFQPLPWKDFFSMKLSSFYLLEAAQSPDETKSALRDLHWFGDLANIYQTNAALTAADATATAAAAVAATPPTPFPMRK